MSRVTSSPSPRITFVEYVQNHGLREVLATDFSTWLLRVMQDLEGGNVDVEDGWPHLKQR